jgi:hypothetical protein
MHPSRLQTLCKLCAHYARIAVAQQQWPQLPQQPLRPRRRAPGALHRKDWAKRWQQEVLVARISTYRIAVHHVGAVPCRHRGLPPSPPSPLSPPPQPTSPTFCPGPGQDLLLRLLRPDCVRSRPEGRGHMAERMSGRMTAWAPSTGLGPARQGCLPSHREVNQEQSSILISHRITHRSKLSPSTAQAGEEEQTRRCHILLHTNFCGAVTGHTRKALIDFTGLTQAPVPKGLVPKPPVSARLLPRLRRVRGQEDGHGVSDGGLEHSGRGVGAARSEAGPTHAARPRALRTFFSAAAATAPREPHSPRTTPPFRRLA